MLQRFARPTLSLVAMLALLLAIVFDGQRFFWCPIMLESRQTCCCPASPRDEPGPAVERKGCCESQSVPASADASVSSDRSSPVALPIAFDSLKVVFEPRSRVVLGEQACARARSPGRLTPPSRGPPHALNCVYMI